MFWRYQSVAALRKCSCREFRDFILHSCKIPQYQQRFLNSALSTKAAWRKQRLSGDEVPTCSWPQHVPSAQHCPAARSPHRSRLFWCHPHPFQGSSRQPAPGAPHPIGAQADGWEQNQGNTLQGSGMGGGGQKDGGSRMGGGGMGSAGQRDSRMRSKGMGSAGWEAATQGTVQ